MSGPNLQVLNLLLERAAAERDAMAGQLQAALAHAQAARAQHGQLTDYRQDYQQRWTATFSRTATGMGVVGCYQSFAQRLDHAVSSQDQIASHADARVQRARELLTAAELRVASVRKLIERRQAEGRRSAERQEQRQSDEFAARIHAQAHAQGQALAQVSPC